ncbi:MAG: queG 1 [Planctomycetaceae bacterium]|nr:queG 1 [Planctomycetaceae bacterium]
MSPSNRNSEIKAEAQRLGFELVGIAPAVSPVGFSALKDWLDHGYAGEMQYLQRRREAYGNPESVLPGVRSIIMLGKNYKTAEPDDPSASTDARVSRYAWGTADYHDVLRKLLKQLAAFVKQQEPLAKTRGIVDTAPLLERDFARLAGLGWFGKNTLLINKWRGSFLFLCALLTDLELEPDAPHETSHCGTCTRCLDACPTDAFVAPYVLDARKCISYLTIELRGPIPEPLRPGIGDWLFGCDVCQDVCPWNRKSPTTTTSAFQPRAALQPADASRLLQLTPEQFDAEFGETPLSRPGRAGILRNAAIVLGNSQDPVAIPALTRGLQDVDPVIREACEWAIHRIELR